MTYNISAAKLVQFETFVQANNHHLQARQYALQSYTVTRNGGNKTMNVEKLNAIFERMVHPQRLYRGIYDVMNN